MGKRVCNMCGRPLVVLFTGTGLGLMLILGFGVATAHGDLLFFKATEDKEIYSRNPDMYDRVATPRGSGPDMVYVERVTALRINDSDIRAVRIEETPVAKTIEEGVGRLLGLDSKKAGGEAKGKRDLMYTVSVLLNDRSTEKMRDFSRKHVDELFDMRFNENRLGVIRFLEPIESGNIGLFSSEKKERLKKIFSPIRRKVTWK